VPQVLNQGQTPIPLVLKAQEVLNLDPAVGHRMEAKMLALQIIQQLQWLQQ